MIIVRMQGGLGNQLFQYALCENFKEMGREVKADISAYQDGREERSFELDKLGLKVVSADKRELHHYHADNSILTDRILRYTIGRKRYVKEKSYDFQPEILNLADSYVSGYWQSEKYFVEAAAEIKSKIIFRDVETDEIKIREKQMESQNSVSVHVRMGDYLERSEMYGGICTREYYVKAFSYILEHVESPIFYVFSDEPQKTGELLKGYNYCLVTENNGADSYKDMYLMSRCKHHIIANSTFSWWGAWLDEKKDKIVITPEKWNNACKTNEICRDGWIML